MENETNPAKQIDKVIKDAEAALEGRRIRAVLLNNNKPGAEELAAAFDTEAIKATAVRFPKEYDQYTCILFPESELVEVSPLVIKGGKITADHL